LSATGLAHDKDLIVVAVRLKGGQLTFHPGEETVIDEGDLLILVGPAESVERVQKANGR
jgi:uncharacterized protein with PhoU and TrkA domain